MTTELAMFLNAEKSFIDKTLFEKCIFKNRCIYDFRYEITENEVLRIFERYDVCGIPALKKILPFAHNEKGKEFFEYYSKYKKYNSKMDLSFVNEKV